jgi:D-alanyl-D-alanine carboxypeptidase
VAAVRRETERLRGRLAEALREGCAHPRLVGAVAAVSTRALGRDGAWTGAAGTRVPGGQAAPSTGVAQPIFSVAKPMLAAGALRLCERGRMALDDPVARHLPGLPSAVCFDGVTVRRTLQHTAGFPTGSLLALETELGDADAPGSASALLKVALRGGLVYPTGLGWQYSNVGYLVASMLVAHVGGGSLDTVLSREVFSPLGMRDTRVVPTAAALERVAPGWTMRFSESDTPADARMIVDPRWLGHGLVASTARDVVAFLDGLFSRRLVGAAALGSMCAGVSARGVPGGFGDPSYGLGMVIDARSPHGRLCGHAGDGPGWGAFACHAPALQGGTSVCVLTNTDGSAAAEMLARRMLDVVAAG